MWGSDWPGHPNVFGVSVELLTCSLPLCISTHTLGGALNKRWFAHIEPLDLPVSTQTRQQSNTAPDAFSSRRPQQPKLFRMTSTYSHANPPFIPEGHTR